MDYAHAAGYLGTLLHQYMHYAKLLSAQAAAWCDKGKKVQWREKMMQNEMSWENEANNAGKE